MPTLRFLLLALFLGVAPPVFQGTWGQNDSWLLEEFDARHLSRADKRFLQSALAFEGHYLGLLDGAWGNLSQRAFEAYAAKEFSAKPEDWHMAALAFSLVEKMENEGWEVRFFDALELSLLVPGKAFLFTDPSQHFSNARHTNSSLSYSFANLSRSRAQNTHDFTTSWHDAASQPYTVRKKNLAITKSKKRDGSVLYTRSNLINGSWSTVMLSAERADVSLLNAVASSISVGKAPAITYTENGHLADAIVRVIAILDEGDRNETEPPRQKDVRKHEEPENIGGTGSGFVVSDSGHVMTNAHVVSGCERVLVDGRPALLVSTSEAFDLALLSANPNPDKSVGVFSDTPARLNSDVTVSGYPYAGLLGGLNVTRGSISSLKGFGHDETQMQISAPVQKGNSGGPVLARDGEIVGVVVAKFGGPKAFELVGDLPQNVNFAVRGEIAKLFLAQNGVTPIVGHRDEALDGETLAENASAITVYVECQ